uniref:MADS-box domain-containing protein n=1 Tax=Heligmosomoides polygyrus TaxID=6339 RepID=A0A183FRR8_HELPZ
LLPLRSTGRGKKKKKGKKGKTVTKRKRRKDRYESQNYLLRIEGTLCCASISECIVVCIRKHAASYFSSRSGLDRPLVHRIPHMWNLEQFRFLRHHRLGEKLRLCVGVSHLIKMFLYNFSSSE